MQPQPSTMSTKKHGKRSHEDRQVGGSACTFDHIPEARVTSTDEQKEETKASINVRGQAP